MKPLMIVALVLSCLSTNVSAQNRKTGEVGTFELTPAAPTTRYWLLTSPLDRLPGNAAFLYADAAATLNDAVKAQVDKALAAYSSGSADFNSQADAVEGVKVYTNMQGTFDLLSIAARREYYNWESSYREQGAETLIPHIVGERALGKLIVVRALRQIHNGQFDDAVGTLRLEYELGRKIGTEPVLVCGLVAVANIGQATDATAELMKQPQSPNLYWALASLPRPLVKLQQSLVGEVTSIPSTFPELATGRLQDVSAEEWHSIFNRIVDYNKKWGDSSAPAARGWESEKTIADEVTRNLPKARDFYSQTFHLSTDQVATFDPFKVVATYWYSAQTQRTQFYDLSALPYPLLAVQVKRLEDRLRRDQTDQPANVFLSWDSGLSNAAETYMRLDRGLAALTDVEAIRSYAAAHDAKLPAHLEDITDTPALENPRTGRPFDYRLQGDTAVLSDSAPANHQLTFTIRIRGAGL